MAKDIDLMRDKAAKQGRRRIASSREKLRVRAPAIAQRGLDVGDVRLQLLLAATVCSGHEA